MFPKCEHIFKTYKARQIVQKILFHDSADNLSPLNGIRILDLTRIVAGPFCTMILGDLGAEVIKIEKPKVGDESRRYAPPFIGNSSEGCYYVAVNRNKKSVCVSLKSEKGRGIIYELAKKSDVFIENYVPGKLDELHLGYEDLRNIAPHLIYCSISGYGPDGPYRKRPGYDVVVSSVGGLLHITGPKDGEPVKVGVPVTDLATGLYAHGAIMASLIKRARTGKGEKIDCNLLSTQLSLLTNIGSNYLNAGQEAKRWGTEHGSIVPYQAFPTKDGYFTLGAGSNEQFKDLCSKLGKSELAERAEFATNILRIKNREELIAVLTSVMKTKSNAEWLTVFEGSSFPCGPINTLKEVFNDPHVKNIGLVKTLEHPIAGEVKVIGPAVKFSEGGNRVRTCPPALGQHTEEVLSGLLGYDKITIDCLKKEEVIQ